MTGVLAVKIVQVEHKKEHAPQAMENVVVDPLPNHATLNSVVSAISNCSTLKNDFDAETVVKFPINFILAISSIKCNKN